MRGYLKVFLYLSIGELIVRFTGFPLPGPIVGLTLMFVDFGINGEIDKEVGKIFDGVSKHLAILFVPAGAGVIAYGGILSSGLSVIVIAVVAGTLTTMLVTALLFGWILGGERREQADRSRSGKVPSEIQS